MSEKEYIIENYLVNYVFKNLFPYDHNSFFKSYMMMMILHCNLIKIHLIGMAAFKNELNEQIAIECIQQFVKTLEHHVSYWDNVREAMEKAGYVSMAHMFILIKS